MTLLQQRTAYMGSRGKVSNKTTMLAYALDASRHGLDASGSTHEGAGDESNGAQLRENR
jgi:hypothetical protein